MPTVSSPRKCQIGSRFICGWRREFIFQLVCGRWVGCGEVRSAQRKKILPFLFEIRSGYQWLHLTGTLYKDDTEGDLTGREV